METITKEEFLQRCDNSEASTNANSLTKEIMRPEIAFHDYYIKNDKIFSVIAFDGEYLIIAGQEEEFQICE